MAFYNQTTCSIRFTRSDYSYAMFREGLRAYAEDYAVGDTEDQDWALNVSLAKVLRYWDAEYTDQVLADSGVEPMLAGRDAEDDSYGGWEPPEEDGDEGLPLDWD
jgi:hypothetical protein